MNITLHEFMTSRKAQIKEQMAALKAELQAIQAAESAVSSGVATTPARTRTSSRLTIKDMIVSVLSDKPEGAEAQEIIDLVKIAYDKEIPRPSISPQLSRLKSEGTLNLDEKNWKLAIAPLQKESAPFGAETVGEALTSPNSNATGESQTHHGSAVSMI